MWHHNPTEKYSKNTTQIEQLHDKLKLQDQKLHNHQTEINHFSERVFLKDISYFSQHIWKVCHEHHKSKLTICRVPESCKTVSKCSIILRLPFKCTRTKICPNLLLNNNQLQLKNHTEPTEFSFLYQLFYKFSSVLIKKWLFWFRINAILSFTTPCPCSFTAPHTPTSLCDLCPRPLCSQSFSSSLSSLPPSIFFVLLLVTLPHCLNSKNLIEDSTHFSEAQT